MPEHRQSFQRELDAVDAKVIELFDLVAADLAGSTPSLPDGNSEVVKVLAEHGLVIDLLGPEIEKLVKTAILLQAPVASDLRFLLCVLRILPELEHSHHLVVQLASRASHIRSEDLSPRSRELVDRMGNLASDMWRRTANSWYQRDHSAAAVLAELDNEMEELHASLIAELSSGRMALAVTIEMTLMAPLYERLSDHAVNIAGQVIYIADLGPSVVRSRDQERRSEAGLPAGYLPDLSRLADFIRGLRRRRPPRLTPHLPGGRSPVQIRPSRPRSAGI